MGIGTLRGGNFFKWDLKNLCIRKVNTNLRKKKDSDCNFYNFSLFVPYPNNFVIVCICNGIYSPLPTFFFFFFVRGSKFFLLSCSYELRTFQISWGPSVLGSPNLLLIERARPFSSIKSSLTNNVKLRTVDGKLSASSVHTNFSHFYFGIFSLFKCPLKLPKKCLPLIGNNSVKVRTLFDMDSK